MKFGHKLMFFPALALLLFAAILATAPSSQAQDAAAGMVTAKLTVTASVDGDKPVPEIKKEDVVVKVGKDRAKVTEFLDDHQASGEVVTGLLYLDESVADIHELNQTPDTALSKIPYEKLCPGSEALDRLQEEYR